MPILKSSLVLVALTAGAVFWPGCAGKPVREVPPPVKEVKSERQKLTDHLVGTWESGFKKDKIKRAVFDANGNVTFQGGLESYNPGRWDLNADSHELHLSFPSAPNEKLQILQLQVGQGVKSFNPSQKQVTYAFTETTWNLNIAGWEYSKPDTSAAESQPEPVFR